MVREILDDTFALFGRLTQESSVTVTGRVSADERAPGGYEIHAQSLSVTQVAE